MDRISFIVGHLVKFLDEQSWTIKGFDLELNHQNMSEKYEEIREMLINTGMEIEDTHNTITLENFRTLKTVR